MAPDQPLCTVVTVTEAMECTRSSWTHTPTPCLSRWKSTYISVDHDVDASPSRIFDTCWGSSWPSLPRGSKSLAALIENPPAGAPATVDGGVPEPPSPRVAR